MEQRSPEWFAERKGKLTASMFGQAAGLGPGSRQQAWRRLLELEVFHGNEATDWGTAHEPVALAAYRNQHPSASIGQAGFVRHADLDWLGCSPDFLIDDSALGEIKCPFSQRVYEAVPHYYMAQVQGQLEVTNRQWAHFVCWTPAHMRVWHISRSPDYWDWLHLRLADFWSWVVAQVEPPRDKRVKPEEIPPVSCEAVLNVSLPT